MPSALPMRYYDESLMHSLEVAANDGRLVGYYSGRPIFEAVYDVEGYRYAYVGVAPRLRNGRLNVTALRAHQWVVEPGLVYEWDRDSRRRQLAPR